MFAASRASTNMGTLDTMVGAGDGAGVGVRVGPRYGACDGEFTTIGDRVFVGAGVGPGVFVGAGVGPGVGAGVGPGVFVGAGVGPDVFARGVGFWVTELRIYLRGEITGRDQQWNP